MQERILHKSFYRNYEMMFSTVWKTCFHGVENFSGLAHDVSRSYAPLAALAGDGARPGAAPLACARRHVSCGAAGAPLSPGSDHAAYGGCRECGILGGGEAGAAVSRLGFPPGAPFRRRPFSARIIAGGKPIPFVAGAPSLGQPHGGHFRLERRRPSGPPA
jgi:hypothetical protein